MSSRSKVHLSALICAPLCAFGLGAILKSLPGLRPEVSFLLGAHSIIPLWAIFAVTFVLVERAYLLWIVSLTSLALGLTLLATLGSAA